MGQEDEDTRPNFYKGKTPGKDLEESPFQAIFLRVTGKAEDILLYEFSEKVVLGSGEGELNLEGEDLQESEGSFRNMSGLMSFMKHSEKRVVKVNGKKMPTDMMSLLEVGDQVKIGKSLIEVYIDDEDPDEDDDFDEDNELDDGDTESLRPKKGILGTLKGIFKRKN